jgi:hypothetical protein
VIVHFSHAAGGLAGAANDGQVLGFAVAGADRRFHWAEAKVERSTVILSRIR